jgi:hypothetical protein
MKLFLEMETEKENDLTISKIKEVANKMEAIKDKPIGKKCFLHICYHDEKNPKPCKWEAI